MEPIIINDIDYFNFSGINIKLDFMNGQTDDGTSGANRYLKNVSIDTWDYLRNNFIFDEKKVEMYFNKNPHEVLSYKRALCHQVEYLMVSGDTRKNAELVDLLPNIKALSPKAKDIFRRLGLTNVQFSSDIYRRY